jgi:hypothetical protein
MDLRYLTSPSGVLFPIHGRVPMAERASPADPSASLTPKMAAMAGGLYYENGFAPLGDMMGMHRLAMLFTNLGATITETRAHQLTLEELKKSDLVFLGAFRDRGTLIWLPEQWPWRFTISDKTEIWQQYIFDTRAPADARLHFGLGLDPVSHVIRTDHALISVVPGVNPNHRVVILAGLTTSATQGAAEFLSSEAGLHDLLAALGTKQNGRLVFPRFFQCILRVEVAHGLDVIRTKYVTGDVFQPKL